MFTQYGKEIVAAIHDKRHNGIHHAPIDIEQGSLFRGRGIWERKACIYDVGFRRLTVEQIERHVRAEKEFICDVGARGLFSSVMIVPKRFDDEPKNFRQSEFKAFNKALWDFTIPSLRVKSTFFSLFFFRHKSNTWQKEGFSRANF